jgi:PAS domain S-box-containing protein
LLESIPQLAWTANEQGEVDYCNSGWYAYTGQRKGEALGDGWTSVTHKDDLLLVIPAWKRALEIGEPYEVECRYLRARDQIWRWHLTRAVALKNESGEIVRWVGSCTDIHEAKLYTERLLERESYFREMADKVPVIMWVTAPDGSCAYLNKGWYSYTGQKEAQALGHGWLDAIHGDDFSTSQAIFLEANRQRKAFSMLYRLKSSKGSYRWFLDRGEPSFDARGNFEGFIGAVIDVNEQKSAEDRLSLSVKAGKVGIWEWDIINDRATYSDLLQEMFGFESDSLEENFEGAYGVYQSVIYPEDRQGVNEAVAKAFANKEKEFYVEFRVQRPSGEIAWIAERGEVIFTEGQPIYMNGTCIDITERKKIEGATQRLSEELAAANEELRAANEEIQAANEELNESNQKLSRTNAELDRTNKDLDNFVYTASHDLKAPILNMEGLLNLLGKQIKEEIEQNLVASRVYESLYASVARFKNTISDLTQVAKINKDNPEDITYVDLSEVYEQVRKDLEPQILEAGAEIDIHLDCPQVHFSKKNLQSILYNLLSNALKYRSSERELFVRISCYSNQSHHLLTIEDNGLGMDMRQEEKIFALFKRLHTHVEGTGIGLYIVKKMLENGGGKIEVESKLGVGSTFKVYFKH